MTSSELNIGDRVRGKDRDLGKILAIDGDLIYVGWQSGVKTWTPISELEKA